MLAAWRKRTIGRKKKKMRDTLRETRQAMIELNSMMHQEQRLVSDRRTPPPSARLVLRLLRMCLPCADEVLLVASIKFHAVAVPSALPSARPCAFL